MAANTALEKYLTCSICQDTFKEPVSLGCNHSFCKKCLQDDWDKNQTKNCPLCQRTSSTDLEVNSALKEVCSEFTEDLGPGPSKKRKTEKKDWSSEKVKANQQKLESLKAERQRYEDLEKTYEKMDQFNRDQAVRCERVIRVEFSRLHSLVSAEEQRALSALREADTIGPELQEVREKLRALSKTIQELETGSDSPEQQIYVWPKAGLLLDQAKILGNLGFRVWSNMRRVVSYCPVLLDPNTAHGGLYLSDDLRGVRIGDKCQKVPDNPERFTKYAEVLGSEGFSSGSHQWDVEVGDLPFWAIGVATESVERKEKRTISPEDGIWALVHNRGIYTKGSKGLVPVPPPLQKLRVKLDYDKGEVSFYDADHMTHLDTYTGTFTEKIFPYFRVGKAGKAKTTELRILPSDDPPEETAVKEAATQ